ncbi:MAG: PilZ domain-containing protein [Proteobacteria bacterium]|nr:PilZ domain-containing protein [Pseudomonadota bacterium]
MSSQHNVIDLKVRLKSRNANTAQSEASAEVVSISEKRQEILQADRRQVKRTILTEFIAVHAVVPGMGLMKVILFDITEKGLSFDLEEVRGQFQAGEEISMRVYLNHQTYFPFTVKVRHVTHIKDESVYRHGVEFMKETLNDEALYHFVKFIETVSAGLKSDRGDVLVSNINS